VANVVLDRRALQAQVATPFLAGGDMSALTWMESAGTVRWGPIMTADLKVGWALGEGSGEPGPKVVSNTTLFDFQGKALPVLNICKRCTQ
jgi:hypothetical protein